MNRTKVYVQRTIWKRGVDLYVVSEGDVYRVGEPVVMKPQDDITPASSSPTIFLANEEAQGLMDELWLAGFRPTEGTGSAGAMRAVERHLEDMRAIVSAKLEVQLEKPGRE